MSASILAFYVNVPAQVGEEPRRVKLITKNTLAEITTAGYLDSVIKSSGLPLRPTDLIDTWFGATSLSSPGTYAVFTPTIGNLGTVTLNIWENPGDVLLPVTDGNLPSFIGTNGQIEDSGIPSSTVLLTTTDVTDYQEFVSINDIIATSAGTWLKLGIGTGNYVFRHTPGDDTTVMGIDITPAIRAAAGRGFKLASLDIIYSIGTVALDAHTLTLSKVNYSNNAAVTVTSIPVTGSLATATQAQPYLSNITVTTPAFNVTSVSKYVLELTINAAATTTYDFYGANLHFTKSVA